MALQFKEYQAKSILNVHKHVDGAWFWDKYSATPYVGCQSGCEFCYCRGGRYAGRRDPETFDTIINIKINAVERLREEICGLPPEIISVGDWQRTAEDRYRLSRGLLEVVLEAGFPLFIVERSPLLARDLDLLCDINARSWAGVLFSISSLDTGLKNAFEPRSPGVTQRLKAMSNLAEAGISVGTSLIPVIPFVGDGRRHLEEVIQATVDHGGKWVLAGGLTMSGVQAGRTVAAAKKIDPELEKAFREMYRWTPGGKPNYSPPMEYTTRILTLVRELCTKHHLQDRMPRYIAPGPLAVNKWIAERLFLETFELELEGADSCRIWAYRKAAWTVDELTERLDVIYAEKGEAGLRALPNIGNRIGSAVAKLLEAYDSQEKSEEL